MHSENGFDTAIPSMPVAKSGTFADLVERYRSQKINENLENSSSNIPQVKKPPRIAAFAKDDSTAVDMEVFVDGPYGSPSSDIYQAEHAVLVATGIGVTPYASVLQSIMARYRRDKTQCPRCHHQWTGDIAEAGLGRLRKVDFFWINRNQFSFEWFVRLLSQLEVEQAEMGGGWKNTF